MMLIDMLSRTPRREPRPLTGRAVLAIMLAFFAVVAGVNALMMTMAIRTMPGLDARNGYEVSQRYNGEIARMAGQGVRGWRADLSAVRVGGSTQIVFSVAERDNRAVNGLEVEARLMHPASRQLDRTVALAPIGDGRYAAVIPGVAKGQWTLAIDAGRNGERLFSSQNRFFLKD
jgi:nitrogen fixation protein FixH